MTHRITKAIPAAFALALGLSVLLLLLVAAGG